MADRWRGPCSFCGAPVQLPAPPPPTAKVRCPRCRESAERGAESILNRLLVFVANRQWGGGSDA